eukprot:Skav209406  [mRNA]  locus=scaffold2187:47488:53835:+ [translate_table: standard]
MSTESSTATRSWVALLAAAGASTAWFFWRRWRDRRLPPGNVWMLPLLGESLSYVKSPLGFIEDSSARETLQGGKLIATDGRLTAEKLSQHGGTCRSNLLFSSVVILGVTEENAKLILSKKDLGWPQHFQKVVGTKALPMVNDPLHKKIRNVNSRAFADKQLDCYLSKLQRLTAKHLEAWLGGESRDLHMEVKKYAFECGEAVILGESDQVKTDRYMQLYDQTFQGGAARRQLVEGFKEVIQQKRNKLKLAESNSCQTWLSLLIGGCAVPADWRMQTEGMDSEEELLDFCVGMMFAAHDTTLCSVQSSLHWLKLGLIASGFMLKQFPELEQQLRKEVRELWDGESTVNRKEVLRMTPPVAIVTRTVSEDTEVDGYIVPKGWQIYYAPAGKHSKAEDPKSFCIQRHLKDGKFLDRTFEATYFNSFGGGNRMCIGDLLADPCVIEKYYF